MIKDIFKECPTYKKELITLSQTNINDAQELLKCYSDEKAVPFFNSDNCHGDDFHYKIIERMKEWKNERMKEAINFWNFSYRNNYFVRWTVILKDTKEKIGTIEMFHRILEDEFNHNGILRIDLQSKYETQPIINEILEIVNENFYKAFDVKAILTKAIPEATERITSLVHNGYQPINRKIMIYDDYFVKLENK